MTIAAVPVAMAPTPSDDDDQDDADGPDGFDCSRTTILEAWVTLWRR